jgi:arsenite-transporting ATPase
VKFLDAPPRFVLFTGKGGVGKTSLACASAVHLADAGRRVLLVSTDPASNVGQVFGVRIGNRITPITAVPGLDAIEIDPQQAADDYRERIIGPVRDLLPAKEIAEITEQLSGSCTTEVASFNEFTSFLAGPASTAGYDHIIFDTAPTGHTIRLLQRPGDWTNFLNSGKGDASCLGPLSGLDKQRSAYAEAVGALTDPARTALVLVARAQQSSLGEVARTAVELQAIGIAPTSLVVNAVLPDDVWPGVTAGDRLAAAIRAREQAALGDLPAELRGLPCEQVSLKAGNAVGVDALRGFLADNDAASALAGTGEALGAVENPWPGLDALVAELATADHGLVMCMGKGGVGKTAIAAALALALAQRGRDVHLTTTDPAGRIDPALGGVPGLRTSRIDPAQAIADYRAHVMATKGNGLDEAGRAVLAEDLMSPCTEEIAVFEAFSRVVKESRERIVVIDTAPTGHTLLLLDATGSYHRDIARHMPQGMAYTTPLMRLQDPEQTRIIIVTLPETTPVLEAEHLAADLVRAGIQPWAWVVNQSIAATDTTSGLLRRRAEAEREHIAAVTGRHGRVAVVGLAAEEPSTLPALRSMVAAR